MSDGSLKNDDGLDVPEEPGGRTRPDWTRAHGPFLILAWVLFAPVRVAFFLGLCVWLTLYVPVQFIVAGLRSGAIPIKVGSVARPAQPVRSWLLIVLYCVGPSRRCVGESLQQELL